MRYDLLSKKHVKGFLERIEFLKKRVKEREGKRNFSVRLALLCPLSNSNNATLLNNI